MSSSSVSSGTRTRRRTSRADRPAPLPVVPGEDIMSNKINAGGLSCQLAHCSLRMSNSPKIFGARGANSPTAGPVRSIRFTPPEGHSPSCSKTPLAPTTHNTYESPVFHTSALRGTTVMGIDTPFRDLPASRLHPRDIC